MPTQIRQRRAIEAAFSQLAVALRGTVQLYISRRYYARHHEHGLHSLFTSVCHERLQNVFAEVLHSPWPYGHGLHMHEHVRVLPGAAKAAS